MNFVASVSVFTVILLFPDAHAASITYASSNGVVKTVVIPTTIIISPTKNTNRESIEYTITINTPIQKDCDHKHTLKLSVEETVLVLISIVLAVLAYIFVAMLSLWIVRRLQRLCASSKDDDVYDVS